MQGSFLMLGSMCLDNVMFFRGLHCMIFFSALCYAGIALFVSVGFFWRGG